MLRLRNFLIFIIASVLVTSGPTLAQPKGNPEVTITRCWQFPAEDVLGLASDGRDVFAAADGARVFALSAKGEKLWQTDLGGEAVPDLRFDHGAIGVTTRAASGALTANRLSPATGVPISGSGEPAGTGKSSETPNTKASAGDVVILGDNAGMVTSLSGGGPVWRFKTGGAISAVIPVGDDFIVISRDNFVYALHAKNGALAWKRRTQGRIGHFGVGKSVLFVSSLDQPGATFIDLATGRVAGQLILSGDEQVIADPVVVDDDFVIATSLGVTDYSLDACSSK